MIGYFIFGLNFKTFADFRASTQTTEAEAEYFLTKYATPLGSEQDGRYVLGDQIEVFQTDVDLNWAELMDLKEKIKSIRMNGFAAKEAMARINLIQADDKVAESIKNVVDVARCDVFMTWSK